jgi:hypothetical protein
VKEPKEGGSRTCPVCGRPGPWASVEERAAYDQAAAQQHALEEQRRLELLQQALALVPISAPGFIGQKDEDVYTNVPARLFEWKKERGHYEGGQGFRGLSVRVPGTKTMRAYYGGLSQRRYVQGEEHWRETADGAAVVTNKRIVFRSTTKNIEWAYAKLVGIDADPQSSAIVLQVSNRQASHVLNVDDLEPFLLKIEAAIAQFQGRPAPTLQPPTTGTTQTSSLPAPSPGVPPRPD